MYKKNKQIANKINITTMKVGLFVPCYVDALYPEAGVATYKLLKHYGLDVGYPEKQTCCGQPMANAGFQLTAPCQGHRSATAP